MLKRKILKIAFYKGKGDWIDKLIRFWTGGVHSHVELVFDDGACFSSSTRYQDEFQTRFKKIQFNPDSWDFLEIPIDDIDEFNVFQFCLHELNCDYDFKGIFFSQVLKLGWESKTKWFCSEVVTAALQHTYRTEVIEKTVKPCTISPNSLYLYLKNKGY